MGTLAQALTDKDFLAAHPDDQKAYLSSIDKDFAAAKPEDQNAYLNHVLAPGRLAKSAQVTETEKAAIGKGYITPAQEKENVNKLGYYGPITSALEKHGITPGHLASEGWEGLKDIGQSVKSVAGDIGSSRPLLFGSAEEGPQESTFHKYVIHPSEIESEKARHAGSDVESIGHSVAAALPVIGPAIANLSEQAGTGDIGGAIGRGAGQAAGAKLLSKVPGVLPKLEVNPVEIGAGLAKGELTGVKVKTSEVVQAGRRMMGKRLTEEQAAAKPATAEFHPALGNTAREVLEHAQKEGIELTPGQATNMPLPRMIQAIGERSLFGSDKLAEGIDKNAGAFMKATRGFADRVDPKAMGLSEESAGEAIKQATETGKSVSHENASAGFKDVIDAHGKEIVDTSNISKKWQEARESLPMGAEEKILAEVPRNMAAHVEELLSPTGMKAQLPFEKAVALRSVFRELGESDTLPTKSQGVFRQMMKATDMAMETAADKGNFTKEWREGNKGWKDYVEKYGDKQSPLARILKQADPAKITRDLLNRASAKDIEILKNEKLDSALEALKRQVIEEIAKNKFTVGRNGLGGFSHSFLHTLFGPEAIKELYLKADIGRRFNWQMNPSGTSNVMMAESQIAHPEPSKLGLLYGAARTSMPRPAGSYLPDIAPAGQVKPLGLPVPGAPPERRGGRGNKPATPAGWTKGGINPAGMEASIKPIETQDMIEGLSTQIARMKDTLRTSTRPAAEKTALQKQIDEYQERVDMLRAKGKNER